MCQTGPPKQSDRTTKAVEWEVCVSGATGVILSTLLRDWEEGFCLTLALVTVQSKGEVIFGGEHVSEACIVRLESCASVMNQGRIIECSQCVRSCFQSMVLSDCGS
jgi:hypothetical protein